jgi:hypothetical protein
MPPKRKSSRKKATASEELAENEQGDLSIVNLATDLDNINTSQEELNIHDEDHNIELKSHGDEAQELFSHDMVQNIHNDLPGGVQGSEKPPHSQNQAKLAADNQSLAYNIAAMETRILNLTLLYSEHDQADENLDEKLQAAQKTLTMLYTFKNNQLEQENKINELELYKKHMAEEQTRLSSRFEARQEDVHPQFPPATNKHSYKLPVKSLPALTYDSTSSLQNLFEETEAVLASNNIPESQYTKALIEQTKIGTLRVWIHKNIIVPNLTWEQAKLTLSDRLGASYSADATFEALLAFEQRQLSVSKYRGGLEALASAAGRELGDPLIKGLFKKGLNTGLKENVDLYLGPRSKETSIPFAELYNAALAQETSLVKKKSQNSQPYTHRLGMTSYQVSRQASSKERHSPLKHCTKCEKENPRAAGTHWTDDHVDRPSLRDSRDHRSHQDSRPQDSHHKDDRHASRNQDHRYQGTTSRPQGNQNRNLQVRTMNTATRSPNTNEDALEDVQHYCDNCFEDKCTDKAKHINNVSNQDVYNIMKDVLLNVQILLKKTSSMQNQIAQVVSRTSKTERLVDKFMSGTQPSQETLKERLETAVIHKQASDNYKNLQVMRVATSRKQAEADRKQQELRGEKTKASKDLTAKATPIKIDKTRERPTMISTSSQKAPTTAKHQGPAPVSSALNYTKTSDDEKSSDNSHLAIDDFSEGDASDHEMLNKKSNENSEISTKGDAADSEDEDINKIESSLAEAKSILFEIEEFNKEQQDNQEIDLTGKEYTKPIMFNSKKKKRKLLSNQERDNKKSRKLNKKLIKEADKENIKPAKIYASRESSDNDDNDVNPQNPSRYQFGTERNVQVEKKFKRRANGIDYERSAHLFPSQVTSLSPTLSSIFLLGKVPNESSPQLMETSFDIGNTSNNEKPNQTKPVETIQSLRVLSDENKSLLTQTNAELLVPCLFERSIQILALADSGSNSSVLTAELAKQAGLTVAPSESIITNVLGKPIYKDGEVGVTEAHLCIGSFQRKIMLQVVPYMSGPQLLLGWDALPAFGISLTGVPVKFPKISSVEKINLPIISEESSVYEIEKHDSETLSSSRAYTETEGLWKVQDQLEEPARSVILTSIASLLEINASIPKDSFCTHPSFLVHLNTGSNPPVYRRQYPLPHKVRPFVTEKINEWFAHGVLVKAPYSSPWNSPILGVPKRDSNRMFTDVRTCIDPRAINKLLPDAEQAVPKISELFGKLSGFKVASALDFEESYTQCRVSKEDRIKLTISWDNQRYMFARAPFGLKHLTQLFQSAMEETFGDVSVFVVIYIDDLLVFSSTPEEHTEHLIRVLQIANKFFLRLRMKKCSFAYVRIRLLGHLLSGSDRSMDKEKLDVLCKYGRPKTGTQIQAFLGFVNYLRDYIPHYATIAAPLEKLRNIKNVEKVWTELCEDSYTSFRNILSTSPVLEFPRDNVPYIVATDASQTGVGAVLFQNYDGRDHYIVFASKALSGSQLNYPATKRELLAVMFALQRFREYLFGTKFELRTDHKALTFMFTQKHVNHMMLNWLDTLLEFDFSIVHYAGILLTLPDSLSRLYPDFVWKNFPQHATGVKPACRAQNTEIHEADVHPNLPPEQAPPLQSIKMDGLKQAIQQTLKTEEEKPVENHLLIQAPLIQKPPEAEMKMPMLLQELVNRPDKELCTLIRDRLNKKCPAADAQKALLLQHHQQGHFGANYLYQKIWNSGLYWPLLRQQCDTIVSTCANCMRYNVGRSGFNPMQSVTAMYPFDHIAIDLFSFKVTTPRGINYVLVMVDIATRYVFLRGLPSKEAISVALELWRLFCEFGVPKVIQSDNGREFVNKVVSAISELAGVNHRLTAPYNPRANGTAERHVQTALSCIRKMASGNIANFDLYLPAVQMSINTKINPLHGSTPFALFFGRPINLMQNYTEVDMKDAYDEVHIPTSEQLLERSKLMMEIIHPEIFAISKESHAKSAAKVNKKRGLKAGKAQPPIPVHSTVMIKDVTRSSKSEPFFVGPYKILKVSKGGTYTLLDSADHLLARPVPRDQIKLVSPADDTFGDPQGDIYYVEQILEDRGVEGKKQYLVKWYFHPSSQNSWEPEGNFEDHAIIKKYWAAKTLKQKQNKSNVRMLSLHCQTCKWYGKPSRIINSHTTKDCRHNY